MTGLARLLAIHHSLRVTAVSLFNNSEEVKVSVPSGARVLMKNEPVHRERIENWVRLYRRVRRTKGVERGQT